MRQPHGGPVAEGPVVLAGPTDEVLSLVGLTETALRPGERDRADALRRPADRRDFVAAHLLVRVCAAHLLRLPAQQIQIVQRCASCGGDHGQPSVPGAPQIGVSLSHARGHVAAAAGAGPVGVDIEPVVDAGIVPELAGSVLAAGERAALTGLAEPAAAAALTRQWVRKEALVKIGVLTLDSFAELDLSGLPIGPPPRGHTACWAVPGLDGVHLVDWVDPRADVYGAVVTRHPMCVALATGQGWAPLPEAG